MVFEYKIEKLDFSIDSDMDKLVELQNIVYRGKHCFTSSSFKYWYLDNPNGHVISYNALYGDIIAAHYALIPINIDVLDKTVKGLLSMATVTHPDHRGQGLFKTLAKASYDYAKNNGFKFVIGVANADSFPGFIKYFDFDIVGQLEVLVGFSNNIKQKGDKLFKVHWDDDSLKWRSNRTGYTKDESTLYGTKGFWKFNDCPGVKTFLGKVDSCVLREIPIKIVNQFIRPLNLYVGLGSNAKDIGYIDVPKFFKRSPFNLIFMDLTGGSLPKMTKDNIFFQLMDFDVA